MLKKIIWLILVVLLIGFGVFMKKVYPGSQWQLENSLKHVSGTPIEHYFNTTEKNCGVWYESYEGETLVDSGKTNAAVKQCFQEAFDQCLFRNILIVNDRGLTDEKSIVYSLIRIVKANDQNECIIQNYFEEYNVEVASDEQIPLNFINTCTVLSDDFQSSCQPLYIDELKKMMKADKEEAKVEVLDGEVQVEINN